ncbi:MAG: sugar phosphate nucleotidyltransferase [candidate division Zixibacteria bacterium]|nr:sugar phosphate nucleotidyltransferase [candidate division Zixibacteria bacterium]
MKAIVMAGGFGTRLRPLTINLPKPMVPIANIPMMEHVVSLLKKHNITDITSLLYFQPGKIRDYFGDGSDFGVSMQYTQPDDDYGTAGAVRFALSSVTEPVMVISGDLITDFNLTEAIAWHRDRQADATILLTRMENPIAYGIVITEEDGRINRFLEKPSWGEAFSDTINTGIYILEPSAIELIPPRTNFDFSKNLYPLMLSREMNLYGKAMKGYWKDIGNVNEYKRAHVDLFNDTLDLDLKMTSETTDEAIVYRGKDVKIEDDVKLTGRIILGNDVFLESGVKLHNCVIGHRSHIDTGAELKNCVLWSDCSIGAESNLSRSVIGSNARLGRNVQLIEDVIVSNDTVIGDDATIKANCKIWPGKTVDSGSIVSSSIVWGDRWNRELFTNSKMTGLALTEITPEMTVKVGAAFGAFLGAGNEVVISRDASDTSRLLKRGLMSGLLAAGVNVADLETQPIPIVRYGLHHGSYAAGIFVHHNPNDYHLIDCIFFDGSGLDMPTGKLKKVERMYFGEDFERASLDNIGHLDMVYNVLENYREDFFKHVNIDLIRRAGFKVVVDHSNGSSSQIFTDLFSQLGVSRVELNANLNPRKFSTSPEEYAQSTVQLSSIVTSLHADVGFLLNPVAEKLSVVDNEGNSIDTQLMLLIMIDLFLQTSDAKKIAVPVSSSMGVEEIAREHGVEVIRVANDHLSMMEIILRGEVDFVGGTRGGFIFPGFQMGADAMVALVKLLEMMAQTQTRLSELRKKFEHFNRQSISIPCPWSKKGRVMRKLITSSEEKQRQLVDGVRIREESGWVLVIPDRTVAAFEILAESHSSNETTQLIDNYRNLLEEWQQD